jgi:beta-aspartyl-peptidase (threonine type)
MQYGGASLAQAAEQVIKIQLSEMGGDGGVIAIDPAGNLSLTFNTSGMYRASIDTRGEVYVAIFGDK